MRIGKNFCTNHPFARVHIHMCARFSYTRQCVGVLCAMEWRGRVMRALHMGARWVNFFSFFFLKIWLYQNFAVPLHRISKQKTMPAIRTPIAYVADIEEMIGKSNRTARRVMKRIRERYHLHPRQHPTVEQVQEYFRLNTFL